MASERWGICVRLNAGWVPKCTVVHCFVPTDCTAGQDSGAGRAGALHGTPKIDVPLGKQLSREVVGGGWRHLRQGEGGVKEQGVCPGWARMRSWQCTPFPTELLLALMIPACGGVSPHPVYWPCIPALPFAGCVARLSF